MLAVQGNGKAQILPQVPTIDLPDGDSEKGKGDKGGANPQHILAAPGLPTVSRKLAQRIWNLEFIEMEEFLSTNKVVQSLESTENLSGHSGMQSQSRHGDVGQVLLTVPSSDGTEKSKPDSSNAKQKQPAWL